MTHETIITDTRGRLRISVDLITDKYFSVAADGSRFRYDVTVWHKAPRKRNEINNPTIATPTEIYEAKIALWNKIKPQMPQ